MAITKSNVKISVNKITCPLCNEAKSIHRDFYKSKDVRFEMYENRCYFCKSCLENMCFDERSIPSLEGFKLVLKDYLNLPFNSDLYKEALSKDKRLLGYYITQLNTRSGFKGKDLTWEDGEEFKKKTSEITKEDNNSISNSLLEETDFGKLSDKWGFGYTNDELIAFEKKYQQLKNNYSEKTAMHTEALLTYIRYRVKEEMSTANNSVDDAKKWADMANKAATNAKINPSQLSKADLSEGLSTFSELSLAVEKEVDIIPILPRFKCRPNDALDFNIWCYVNYIRDLQGLPPCKYEDVYAFYDRRKKEYVEQYGDPYGIFSDDTSEKNREGIKKFIKVDEDSGSDE